MALVDHVKRWRNTLAKKLATRDGIVPTNYAATYGNGNSAGFAGGAVGRLTASMATWSGAVNIDLDASLIIMRARARQLAQSNEYGRRFLSLCAANIVGQSGPKLQVRAYKDQLNPNPKITPSLDNAANDAVEIHWKRWGKKSDITGRAELPLMLRMAAKAVARDGETLVRIVRDKKLPYGMALQLLEADRLAYNYNLITQTFHVRQGVEMDSTGRPIAYWMFKNHPGERYNVSPTDMERIPAGDLIHVFLPERAEQVRGYTWFHAVLMRATQLHGFNESAVIAARLGASKVAVMERAEEAPDATATMADGQVGGAFQMNAEPGEMFELPPGYKINSWNPEYPHANFQSFVTTAMQGISAGLDVANHNLSGDMTGVNYSSARIAELTEREQWMVLQDWFIAALLQPIFEQWLALALLRGDITFEISGKALPADKLAKFANAAHFQGRRWTWVDPRNEALADELRLNNNLTSRTALAAAEGVDFDDILDELTMEKQKLEAAGLYVQVVPPQSPPSNDPGIDPTLNKLLEDLRDEIRAIKQ
jgi:lambda family phage portal protein